MKTETPVKEKPIIFSPAMVQAILEGRKTQTRRVIKPQPSSGIRQSVFVPSGIEDGHGRQVKCPFGQSGDHLWVREAFARNIPGCEPQKGYTYKADHISGNDGPVKIKWLSPIFMPRWESRLTLKITGLRIERLHDISEVDAIAEGVIPKLSQSHKQRFASVWDSLHKEDGYIWDINPRVWVIEFNLLKGGAL